MRTSSAKVCYERKRYPTLPIILRAFLTLVIQESTFTGRMVSGLMILALWGVGSGVRGRGSGTRVRGAGCERQSRK